MKRVITTEGVVAEYEGKYWGKQHGDSSYTHIDFGEIYLADIGKPEHCTKPTHFTYDPKNTGGRNPAFDKLQKARLVRIRKTVTIEFEILD